MRIMHEANIDFDESYDWEITTFLLNPRSKLEPKPISNSTLNKRRKAYINYYGESPGADLSRLRSAFDPPHNWLAGQERWTDTITINKNVLPKVLEKMNSIFLVNKRKREYWPQKQQQRQKKLINKDNII